MAVGAGALWAVGVDNRIYRIDPATSRIVAKIPVATRVSTLAAGAEGVWFLNWTRPRRDADRPGDEPRRRSDPDRDATACPASPSAAAPSGSRRRDDGRLWRIEPGPRPRVRPIDVGGRPSFVSYGDGAAWTADYRGRRARSRRCAHERRDRGSGSKRRRRWPSAPARPGSASRAGPGRARCRRRPAPPSSPAARRPTC